MEALQTIKILAFDVFGTVVDWHSSVVREIHRVNCDIDAAQFARDWRSGYQPAMQQVVRGITGWKTIDRIHREILDRLLAQYGITHLTEKQKQDLNHVWQRLQPWPDSISGMTRLKSKYIVCALSNGNTALLTHLARHAGLPWDCILSAEMFKTYKPDPAIYLGAAEMFSVTPAEVMMVAAHQDDLDGARACGLATAFIERPDEFGRDFRKDNIAHPDNTLQAVDMCDLARQLHC